LNTKASAPTGTVANTAADAATAGSAAVLRLGVGTKAMLRKRHRASPGGCFWRGVGIYNFLKKSIGKKNGWVVENLLFTKKSSCGGFFWGR